MALPQAIDIRLSMLRLAPQCFAFTSSIHSLRELSHALESWIVHPPYGPHQQLRIPQLRWSVVAIDTLHYSCVYSWGGPYVVLQHALGVSSIL